MPRKRIIKQEDSSILQVLISRQTKEAFEQLCLDQGTTMSDEVRTFIETKIKKAAKVKP
jgi:antitoxin component of RelBE/YafQ-DinJ toxin-antitoxin module